jgi:hypothetical protein
MRLLSIYSEVLNITAPFLCDNRNLFTYILCHKKKNNKKILASKASRNKQINLQEYSINFLYFGKYTDKYRNSIKAIARSVKI